MDRAKYGQKLIRYLSDKLTEHRLKGMSITALKTFRQFYLVYPLIGQAVPDQLEHIIYTENYPENFRTDKAKSRNNQA